MKDSYDFLVIGSGIAGLTFALKVAKYGTVAVITKKEVMDNNTSLAQGGIASVFDELDYLDFDKKTDVVSISGEVDNWKVYNDITESLTYDKKTTFGSTIGKYKKLERLFLEDPMVVTA